MLDYSTTDEANDRLWGLSLTAWVQIIVVGVLMVALFRFNLVRLWGKTNPINGQDSNWQHSIFVPLIGLYYLYIHRDELLRAAAAPRQRERGIRWLAFVGLAFMTLVGVALMTTGETGTPLMMVGMMAAGMGVAAAVPTAGALGTVTLIQGILVFAYGIWPGQNDYVKDLGMVITLFGVVTLLCGWQVMKVAWFPIAFLVVALPWPELVYSKLAWPLQQLAASVAVGTLRAFGVVANNFGTKINMVDKKGFIRVLNVAEACAGLKSVMTFLMVGASFAFLSQRALWEKLVITAAAIPIAIFCNVVRVSGQGILDRYWSHEWSEGFAHQFAGLIMVIPGFFLIMFVGWVLDRLFIEELDRGGKTGAAPAAAAAPRTTPRGKRVIVEVPRKRETADGDLTALASAPAATGLGLAAHVGTDEKPPAPKQASVAAIKTTPAATATPAPAAATATTAPVARPAPAKPAATAPSAAPAAKPPAIKPAASAPAVTPPTNKAVPKPAPPAPAKAVALPPTGLKPSGAPRATLPPQGLKPSASPQAARVNKPAVPAAPPAAKPAPPKPPLQQQPDGSSK